MTRKQLLIGDRSDDVRALQESLRSLGHPLEVDGVFGPKTLAEAQRATSRVPSQGLSSGQVADIHEAAALARVRRVVPKRQLSVGAWCGATSLRNPERDVELAISLGLTRLDVVVNDHSSRRLESRFTIRRRNSITALCRRAQDHGIEVHLMSWIMPHSAYIAGAARSLVPLCADVGAASLMWDAEEPWTQARDAMRYADAADLVAESFGGLSCPMGVTGIGYASVAKLGPLIDRCHYAVPQAYTTSTSGLRPGAGVDRIVSRWRFKFPMAKLCVGLAAYRQSGIQGHSAATAIESSLRAALASPRVDTVLYWNLDALRTARGVGTAVRRGIEQASASVQRPQRR